MIYTRDLFTSELFRVNLLSRNLVHRELRTELEALRESPELTVKTEAVGYGNITSNWIGEIQQCFWSTQQPYGKMQYFNRQLLSSNILAYRLKICISIAPWLHVPIRKNENVINAGYWFLAHFSSHFQLPRRERSLLTGKVLCTFWKSQKLIRSEKNQCVLVLRISFCKTEKKITNPQK